MLVVIQFLLASKATIWEAVTTASVEHTRLRLRIYAHEADLCLHV